MLSVRFLAFAAWLNRKPSTAAKEASMIAARLRAKGSSVPGKRKIGANWHKPLDRLEYRRSN